MTLTIKPAAHPADANSCAYWTWEDAFNKFGYEDGDGKVMTHVVAAFLRIAGYTVCAERWGAHNVIIQSIKAGNVELIPADAVLGYDDPRQYLPPAIVDLLDAMTDAAPDRT